MLSIDMKNCANCRDPLQTGKHIGVQCNRCVEYERKYGKARPCEYCYLPAAFREGKCARCTHMYKRFGPPVACINCRVKAAFRTKQSDNVMCRMCSKERRCESRESSENSPSSLKRSWSTSQPPKEKKPLSLLNVEQELQEFEMQKLKEKIAILRQHLEERDVKILEKDKKIASLTENIHRINTSYQAEIDRTRQFHSDERDILMERHANTESTLQRKLDGLRASTKNTVQGE